MKISDAAEIGPIHLNFLVLVRPPDKKGDRDNTVNSRYLDFGYLE